MACETVAQKPKHSVQFQIEETNMVPAEKARAFENVKRRLESVGAENISFVEDGDQKVTFSFQGNIKPQKLHRGFSVAGKLEFFEVCKEIKALYKHLHKVCEIQYEEGNFVSNASKKMDRINKVLGIDIISSSSSSPNFASVSKENIEKVTKMLVQKAPFSINGLEKRVKFLLGKDGNDNRYNLYAVYVTSENKAPLDGSYVIDAAASWSSIGTPTVTIQKNEEGAKIWEQMTEHAYQTQGNIAVVVDDFVYCAPSVLNGSISGGETEISGSFTEDEVKDLANAFRAGAIPKMKILQESILKPYKQKN